MKILARHGLNAFRGWLIGLAEILPGVSGGTVALIVGVYESLIHGLATSVKGLLALFSLRLAAASSLFRKVRWSLIIPVGLGMVAGILLGAAVLGEVLDNYPIQARAVFAGLISTSLLIPIRLVGSSWSPALVGVAAVSAFLSFTLSGVPGLGFPTASPVWIIVAAAAAACALILPGVSGAYLLMSFGLYEQTLGALKNIDLGYIAVFALGVLLGLGFFSRALQWLLKSYYAATLAVMTGLMAGALRGLWPWRGENSEFLPVGENYLAIVAFFLAGAFAALAAISAPYFFGRRR